MREAKFYLTVDSYGEWGGQFYSDLYLGRLLIVTNDLNDSSYDTR